MLKATWPLKMTRLDTSVAGFEYILELVTLYFNGLHEANTEKLRTIFHRDAVLKAPNLRLSLDTWLDRVASRPTPKQLGSAFNYNVLSIEIYGDQAMVKVECPLFDYFYIDYLGLLKENNRWLIVSKMYQDYKAA